MAGTYRMPRDPWAGSRYTFTIPRGWAVQYSHVFNKRADTPQEFGFYAVRVDEIFANACGPSPARPVGPGVSALVTALRRQPGPVVSDPAETTLGGRRAVRLDLTTPKRPQGCPNIEDGGIGLRIWYSKTADKNLLMTFDGMTSVYILEIPRRTSGVRRIDTGWNDRCSESGAAKSPALDTNPRLRSGPVKITRARPERGRSRERRALSRGCATGRLNGRDARGRSRRSHPVFTHLSLPTDTLVDIVEAPAHAAVRARSCR